MPCPGILVVSCHSLACTRSHRASAGLVHCRVLDGELPSQQICVNVGGGANKDSLRSTCSHVLGRCSVRKIPSISSLNCRDTRRTVVHKYVSSSGLLRWRKFWVVILQSSGGKCR